MENHTDHSAVRGAASTAKGFCFGIGDKEQARKDFRRLIGIVNFPVLIVVNVKPEIEGKFKPCQGRYVDYDKMEADGKTLDDYPVNDEPHKMFDEYCTENYSLNDFKELHVYWVTYDITTDPSSTGCLKLRELGVENPEDETSGNIIALPRKISKEILNTMFKHENMTVYYALMALALATSIVFDMAVAQGLAPQEQCFDDFVDILKALTTQGEK